MTLSIRIECGSSDVWTWTVQDCPEDGKPCSKPVTGTSPSLKNAASQVFDAVKEIGKSYGSKDGIPARPELVYCDQFEGWDDFLGKSPVN